MAQPSQKCGNCDAFVLDHGSIGQNAQGTCRARSPTVFPVNISNASMLNPKQAQVQVGFQAAFPPVTVQAWCREWQPADHAMNHLGDKPEMPMLDLAANGPTSPRPAQPGEDN